MIIELSKLAYYSNLGRIPVDALIGRLFSCEVLGLLLGRRLPDLPNMLLLLLNFDDVMLRLMIRLP
jgi:hypothetical protein